MYNMNKGVEIGPLSVFKTAKHNFVGESTNISL